jgi:hypothetical protein
MFDTILKSLITLGIVQCDFMRHKFLCMIPSVNWNIQVFRGATLDFSTVTRIPNKLNQNMYRAISLFLVMFLLLATLILSETLSGILRKTVYQIK